MIAAGIDSGIRFTKAVVLCDDNVVGKATVPTDWEPTQAAHDTLQQALEQAQLEIAQLECIAITGIGADKVELEGIDTDARVISEINAACRGARAVCPQAQTVVDLGAESICASRIEEDGTPGNFSLNDRCAAGAGAFLETLSRIMEVPIDQLSELSKAHTQELSMDTQCAVFAESEIISLIHKQIAPEDIVYAAQSGLASRICSIVLRISIVPPLVMIGASAQDDDLVAILGEKLKCDIVVPQDPEYVSAQGAVLCALRLAKGQVAQEQV